PGFPTLISGLHPLKWTYTIEWADGRADTYVEFDEETEDEDGPPVIGELSFPFGVTTITWTVEDPFGNTDDCFHTITVVDNQNPTADLPAPLNECVENL